MLGLQQVFQSASLCFACSLAGSLLADRLTTDKDCQRSFTGTVIAHYEEWVLVGSLSSYTCCAILLWYGSCGCVRRASAAALAERGPAGEPMLRVRAMRRGGRVMA